LLTNLYQFGYENNNWLNNSLSTYTYDANSNLLAHLQESWKNETWENKWLDSWTYDENNNCILAENFRWIDGSWQCPYPYSDDTQLILYYNNMQSLFFYQNDKIYKMTASYQKVTKPVAIVETHCNMSLRVYPNPTNGQLTISLPNPSEGGAYTAENVEIYNVMGQKLLSIESLKSTETTIDVSHLANGMYFLKVGNQVVKFVKE